MVVKIRRNRKNCKYFHSDMFGRIMKGYCIYKALGLFCKCFGVNCGVYKEK